MSCIIDGFKNKTLLTLAHFKFTFLTALSQMWKINVPMYLEKQSAYTLGSWYAVVKNILPMTLLNYVWYISTKKYMNILHDLPWLRHVQTRATSNWHSPLQEKKKKFQSLAATYLSVIVTATCN